MNLTRVTVTGADDTIEPHRLIELSAKYPFAEWGILVSYNCAPFGVARFPSRQWIDELIRLMLERDHGQPPVNLCMHVCGRWVREICVGEWSGLLVHAQQLFELVQRIQLNFHGEFHNVKAKAFIDGLAIARGKQVIFQLDHVNDALYACAQRNVIDPSCVGLFDLSHGAGVLPEAWPKALPPTCGYAGGLSADNVTEQLARIAPLAGDMPIWIDAETHMRSGRYFDLQRVEAFLQAARKEIKL